MYTPARYLDLHILQAVPAANLNRDEFQDPKSITYGNAERTFVSSQAWKRPIRLAVEDELGEYAARTRTLAHVLADRLKDTDWPDTLADFAAAQVVLSAKKDGLKHEPDFRTKAMLYLPQAVLDDLAALCQDNRAELEEALATHTAEAADDSKKKRKEPAPVLNSKQVAHHLTRRTASINLFGRMLAELSDGHVEAAVQMAPAFTVHRSAPQPDYFTAVEDWPQPGDRGGAHLETAFLTAGVFYRFTTINITELLNNLTRDAHPDTARDLIELFTWHFIMAMPGSRKTATAPHTIPDLVHYTVRDARSISYSAAFEQPVQADTRGGHLAPALTTLTNYATAIDRLVGTRRRIAHGHATTGTPLNDPLGTHHPSFDDLTAACATAALTAHTPA
ncbi:type I-E CRISPR-associated protein Cas7/Cse4/CasC [Streptomyces sp. NPDC051956]|uniref:type I-E CRISPR-associated protein Cas7/Cse4/CasC n=1 Tax=Streptomyces sp. NPDC051956 TaxID=3365677 RepID=UPI0037D951F8